MNTSNNITASVDLAYESIKSMFNHKETKSKAGHLMLAFGDNQGHPVRFARPVSCPITGIKPITVKNVDQITDPQLKRKIADFLLNNRPSKDTDVLEFTSKFNWADNDTTYTVQQHSSLKSKTLLTRAAYIAVQRFKTELDEQRKNKTTATDIVNVFEIAEETKNKRKKATAK